jgi:fructose-bisphosphate aldolase class I
MDQGYLKYKDELIKNARLICTPGKGILAADESTGTIQKRFDSIKVENTEENRRSYRELLFTAPDVEKYLSGVIMYDETFYQKTKDGVLFRDLLTKRGILPGIKVDKGTVPLLGGEETSTQGLDDLGKRCAKYYSEGARFSKWRAVIKIGKGIPTEMAIMENAHGLARYAVICQENGLVPIVEPEVLIDGTHDIETCAKVSERVFAGVVKACQDFGLFFEGSLLKPNMISPGTECKDKVSSQQIAWMTVRTLSRTIPAAMPGIMFLSGGQSEEEASENLNEMNKLTEIKKPWNLSFSYGRALQHSVLKKWLGKPENVKEAQEVLLKLAHNNSLATLGQFVSSGKKGESLHVKNYTY